MKNKDLEKAFEEVSADFAKIFRQGNDTDPREIAMIGLLEQVLREKGANSLLVPGLAEGKDEKGILKATIAQELFAIKLVHRHEKESASIYFEPIINGVRNTVFNEYYYEFYKFPGLLEKAAKEAHKNTLMFVISNLAGIEKEVSELAEKTSKSRRFSKEESERVIYLANFAFKEILPTHVLVNLQDGLFTLENTLAVSDELFNSLKRGDSERLLIENGMPEIAQLNNPRINSDEETIRYTALLYLCINARGISGTDVSLAGLDVNILFAARKALEADVARMKKILALESESEKEGNNK